MDNAGAYENRALLAVDWQVIGRISEAAVLHWDSLEFRMGSRSASTNFTELNINRGKTGGVQLLRMVLHAWSWLMCSLTSFLVTLTSFLTTHSTR